MEKQNFEKFIERQGVNLQGDSVQIYYDLYTKMEVGKHYEFTMPDFAIADHLHFWHFIAKAVEPVINKDGIFIGNSAKFYRQ